MCMAMIERFCILSHCVIFCILLIYPLPISHMLNELYGTFCDVTSVSCLMMW